MKNRAYLLAISFLAISCLSLAAPDQTSIKVGNGITQVDFVGNGVPDLIVTGHRENYNAHSFDVVSFYVPIDTEWDIVPIVEDGKEKLQIFVSGGADCLLHDFRLIKGNAQHAATLIIADRAMGTSFADQEQVVFTYYTLTRRQEVGSPEYDFEKSKTQTAQAKYCDVGDAFRSELGIDAMNIVDRMMPKLLFAVYRVKRLS